MALFAISLYWQTIVVLLEINLFCYFIFDYNSGQYYAEDEHPQVVVPEEYLLLECEESEVQWRHKTWKETENSSKQQIV